MEATNQYEQLALQNKANEEKLLNEEYCVIIHFNSLPHNLRLTYSKRKSGKLIQIEELNAAEAIITSGIFKGKNYQGNLPDDVLNLKPLINQLKPQEWIYQTDKYVDEYYKQH